MTLTCCLFCNKSRFTEHKFPEAETRGGPTLWALLKYFRYLLTISSPPRRSQQSLLPGILFLAAADMLFLLAHCLPLPLHVVRLQSDKFCWQGEPLRLLGYCEVIPQPEPLTAPPKHAAPGQSKASFIVSSRIASYRFTLNSNSILLKASSLISSIDSKAYLPNRGLIICHNAIKLDSSHPLRSPRRWPDSPRASRPQDLPWPWNRICGKEKDRGKNHYGVRFRRHRHGEDNDSKPTSFTHLYRRDSHHPLPRPQLPGSRKGSQHANPEPSGLVYQTTSSAMRTLSAKNQRA